MVPIPPREQWPLQYSMGSFQALVRQNAEKLNLVSPLNRESVAYILHTFHVIQGFP